MNEALRALCENFIKNRDIMKEAFPWDSSRFYPICASIYTEKRLVADAGRLKECRRMFRERVGVFSNFRGAAEPSIVALLAADEDPEARMTGALAFYENLKEYFWGSEYLALAAVMLSDTVDPSEYEGICRKARKIYSLMKDEHPFLTSGEDHTFAVMLALSPRSEKETVRQLEACYTALKEHFFSSNAVQSLSHVLTLCGDEFQSVKDKCDATVALFEALKEKGCKYCTEYGLPTLGVLASLPCERELTVREMIEVDGFLAEQKGYGFFGSNTKKERLMHAGMIVTSEHIGDSAPMSAAAVGGTLSIIAAQHAATCAAIMAASTAAHAAQNHGN